MKCSGSRTDALHKQRYFIDWTKEIFKLAELLLVILSKAVVLINCGIFVTLIERKGVA